MSIITAGEEAGTKADFKIGANTYSEDILSKPKSETRLQAQNPYGNGKSSQIIERIIHNYFN